MAELKNLLETMASVFNKTTSNENSDLDINDDKTLKWKTLHRNQYAKKDIKKGKANVDDSSVTSVNSEESDNDKHIEQSVCKDQSCDTATADVVSNRTRRSTKKLKHDELEMQTNALSNRDKKLHGLKNVSIQKKNVNTKSKKQIANGIERSTHASDQTFDIFGESIAIKLKEISKFSKSKALDMMKDIEQFMSKRTIELLPQDGSNPDECTTTSSTNYDDPNLNNGKIKLENYS